MRRRTLTVGLVAALALSTAACGDDEEVTVDDRARETGTSVAQRVEGATRLTATLTGSAEVPRAGDPDGTGTATVNLDATGGRVCYEVSVQKVEGTNSMHIHEGKVGTPGPIRVELSKAVTPDSTTSGCVDADRTLLGRIAAQPGNFYVNVHSSTYPQGAVRGQLSQ